MGEGTIRVSLGTGDQPTARKRWAALHPQVEALVQLAELQMRSPGPCNVPVDVPRLDPALIRAVAGQAYHDVLATDDRGEIERGFMTPMAGIILDLARRNQPAAPDGVRIAEHAAQAIERSMHAGRVRRRTTAAIDMRISVSELDAATSKQLLETLKHGDRLAPEQVEALALGIRIAEIPSEVDERLKENGLELPLDHVDRRAIALAITRAKLRALNDVKKRCEGVPVETIERPAIVQATLATAAQIPTLSAMQTRWITIVRPQEKQIGDNARYVRLFTGMHGDLPVDQITGAQVRAFRDALLGCPRNAPMRLAKGSVAELSAWAEANPEERRLSRGTINHKALGALSTLLEQARADEHIRLNPVQGLQLPVKASDKQVRRPYTNEEMERIFRTAVYGAPPRIPAAGGAWAAWWLPLLSLFTGARLEELGQASVGDIRKKHGIHYLEVTTLSDEGDERDNDVGKSLKSAAARRRIPLHATLLGLGFLDYVAFVKASGASRLFPHLDEYRGRYTKNFSRWWGRWLTKIGLKDRALTFHSFRHSAVAELRRLRCDASVMKELLGHAQNDVTSGYGRVDGSLHDLSKLDDEIQKMTFRDLNLDRLLGLTPWREGSRS
ncbi:site-specific integrase [Lichenihabitans sp. Uapishka_5]|uniref:site-specific integrase n=1 Tax=Lichenihabitans sp. Uapishka_5 TaxID=3037302 RepID=UPI0029E80B59|nr:site-specific integrase [Lichenihabitans sp. Uapishka_5]MDX7953467.1 site-specific integrase [Lichenihabitans sp. Uapishka_5]